MTVTCTINNKYKYIETIASGPITYEDITFHLLNSDHEHGLGYAELVDASLATPDWSSEEAREIVKLLKNIGHGIQLGPLAVVVSNDYSFGMIRMLGFFLDDLCAVSPFYDLDEAKHWLQSRMP